MVTKHVTVTVTISEKTQELLVEAVDAKIQKISTVLASCLKEKQIEAAKLVEKDIVLLQTLKNDIAQS